MSLPIHVRDFFLEAQEREISFSISSGLTDNPRALIVETVSEKRALRFAHSTEAARVSFRLWLIDHSYQVDDLFASGRKSFLLP